MDRLTKDNYEDDLFEKQKDLIQIDEYTKIRYSQHMYNEDLWKTVKEKEDLEEQIGCPLEVFFKLVKQVKINFNGTMSGYFVFYNLLTKRFEIRNEETMDLFPLTDYKKKFWLREDKSE